MANATIRDARAGFAIYLRASEGVDLDEINAKLEKSGHSRIAQRTLTHYRNLVKAGFNRYISINRFDVARASRAYENMSSLSRYRYRSVDQPVYIQFSKHARVCEMNGQLTAIGDVGAMIEFSGESDIAELRHFRPLRGGSILLDLAPAGPQVSGTIVDIDLKSSSPTVEVEYAQLLSLDMIAESRVLLTTPFLVRILASDDEHPTIDVVGRRLHHVFELIEGLRAVMNEAGRHCKDGIYAAPPVVKEIRVSSPAVLILQLPPELIYLMPWPLIGGGLYLLPRLRKSWYEGTIQKKFGKLVDKEGEHLDAETRLKEIEIRRLEREDLLREELVERVRTEIRESEISAEHLRQVIDAYAVPSWRAIEQSDIREIEVEERIDDDIDSEDSENED